MWICGYSFPLPSIDRSMGAPTGHREIKLPRCRRRRLHSPNGRQDRLSLLARPARPSRVGNSAAKVGKQDDKYLTKVHPQSDHGVILNAHLVLTFSQGKRLIKLLTNFNSFPASPNWIAPRRRHRSSSVGKYLQLKCGSGEQNNYNSSAHFSSYLRSEGRTFDRQLDKYKFAPSWRHKRNSYYFLFSAYKICNN